MGLFGNLKSDGLEETQDRLGGGGAIDSNAYLATIKVAYAGQSEGGAQNVTLLLDLDGREYRETIYVTNKKGENFFLNKDDKTKKVPLPGFATIDDICIVCTEKPLSEQETEEKIVKIYDFEAKAELPKSVPVLTELTGKQFHAGIIKQTVNKNEKQGDEYVPIADTREENVLEKVFHHPSMVTVVEARRGASEAEFYGKWVEKNKGVIRDKRSIKDGSSGTSGKPGSKTPPQSGGSTAPRKSLFGG